MEAAKTELSEAKTQLANAKSHRDDRGHYWMQKIEDAEHDGLKDHGLGEWISNEIHDHAALIKLLSDVCTWIVTGLVIAALLIPGFDVAPLLLFGIMAVALAGHTALAVNGDGSWTDVAMDVIGLVTIGAGGIAGKALESAGDVAGGLLKAADAGEEVEEGATDAAGSVADVADTAGENGAGGLPRLASKLTDHGNYLKSAIKAGGDSKAADSMEKIQNAMKLNPESRWATNVATRAVSNMHTVQVANLVGNTFDQFGHWSGNSDAINFVGNAVTGHPTDGGLLHPNIEGDFAPKLKFMDDFKELTTVRLD